MTRKSHSVTEYTIYLRKNWILIIVFAIAFLVRLIGLNQSLWIDEATTAKVVHSFTYLSILTKFSPGDFHPPLYYWTMKLWTQFFGYSEISLRMPSVIFSLTAGIFIYKSVILLKDKSTAIWATIFFLFNPLIIYYSQEARMYMMATFLLTISYYFLLKVISADNKFSVFTIAKSIIPGILAFFVYYGSVFLLITFFVYLLIKKQYRFLYFYVGFFLIALLIILPLLTMQLANSKAMLQTVHNWSLVLGKANIKNLLLVPLKFTSGRISFNPKIIYYVLSGIWLLFTFWFVLLGFKKEKHLALVFALPLFLGFSLSFIVPIFDYFRFLFVLPFLAIAISLATKNTVIRSVFCLGFIIWSFLYLLNPAMYREDWKSLARNLPSQSVIYALPTSLDPLTYYCRNIQVMDIRTAKPITKNIVVIAYAAPIYGFNYQAKLFKLTYHLQKTANYRGGLSVEFWNRKL